MKNKIISVLALVLMLTMSLGTCFAADAPAKGEAQDYALFIKSSNFDEQAGKLSIVVANKELEDVAGEVVFAFENTQNLFVVDEQNQSPQVSEIIEIPAGGEAEFEYDVIAAMDGDKNPALTFFCGYQYASLSSLLLTSPDFIQIEEKDVLNVEASSKLDAIINFLKQILEMIMGLFKGGATEGEGEETPAE